MINTFISDWADRGLRFIHRHPPNFLFVAGGLAPLLSGVHPENPPGPTAVLVSIAAATVLPRALFNLTRERAFESAAWKNDGDTVRAMLRTGFTPKKIDRKIHLYLAILNHRPATAKALIESMPISDLTVPILEDGFTPLSVALHENQEEIVQAFAKRLPHHPSIGHWMGATELNLPAIVHEYLFDDPHMIELDLKAGKISLDNIQRGITNELDPFLKKLSPALRESIKKIVSEINTHNYNNKLSKIVNAIFHALNKQEISLEQFCNLISKILINGVYFKTPLLQAILESNDSTKIVNHYLSHNRHDLAEVIVANNLYIDPYTKDMKLTEIAEKYLAENPPNIKGVLRITPHIKSELSRDGILLKIADFHLKQTPPQISQARELSKLTTVPFYFSYILEKTSRACLEQTPPDLDKALEIVNSIPDGKTSQYGRLLFWQITDKYLEQKPPNIEKAKQIANSMVDELAKKRIEGLIRSAEMFSRLGDQTISWEQ
jgi:hypothetical protein